MKLVKTSCFTLIWMSAILLGCSKEEIPYSEEITKNLSVSTDRMVFERLEDLQRYIRANEYLNRGSAAQAEKKASSSTSASKTNRVSVPENVYQLIGYDDGFALLFNEVGEVQVNDTIYKITDKGTFFCSVDNIEKLYSFLSNNNQDKINILNAKIPTRDNSTIELSSKGDDSYYINESFYFVETYGQDYINYDQKSNKSYLRASNPSVNSYSNDYSTMSSFMGVDFSSAVSERVYIGELKKYTEAMNEFRYGQDRYRLKLSFGVRNWVVYSEFIAKAEIERYTGWITGWKNTNNYKDLRLGTINIRATAQGKKPDWPSVSPQSAIEDVAPRVSSSSSGRAQIFRTYDRDGKYLIHSGSLFAVGNVGGTQKTAIIRVY